METDEKGVQREYSPRVDVSAIYGLEKMISGNSPVLSVNGYTGNIWITAESLGIQKIDPELITKITELVNAYENGELNGTDESSIKFDPIENEKENESDDRS